MDKIVDDIKEGKKTIEKQYGKESEQAHNTHVSELAIEWFLQNMKLYSIIIDISEPKDKKEIN